MNLATARSAERAREVGVRKVMGSLKQQLVSQFLIEAILLSVAGTAIAIVGARLLLPSFNSLVEKQLQPNFDFFLVAGLLGVALIVGILAGLYPAFVLSSYNPVVVMKGNFTGGSKGAWLRNGLVVFQFMISIVLIVGTVVVGNQMSFMQNKNLGFDKEQVLMVESAFVLDKKTHSFIEELRRMPEVKDVAGTSSRVGNRDDFFGERFQPQGSDEVLTVKGMLMDDDFTRMIGFQKMEGRSFSKETNDSLSLILNETAVKTLGLSDPIGRKVRSDGLGGNQQTVGMIYTVIGIVKDFNFQSLRDEITPLAIHSFEMFSKTPNVGFVSVKLKPGQAQAALAKIQNKWNEMVPNQPFQYEFLDENLAKGYAEEQRSGKVFAVFSGLAIIIACVGLYGLSAYTASLRVKEIGISKVMGASVTGVVVLLSKDFTKLVLIAFALSVPLAWWMMDSWLKGFAFRISLGAGSFALAGAIALGIAWLTVSYQSIKASIANPINSLRGE